MKTKGNIIFQTLLLKKLFKYDFPFFENEEINP
jgi:hypothetical protein